MNSTSVSYGQLESEKGQRVHDMLVASMGPLIQKLLSDDDVVEVMLNPDGKLWVDRLSAGRSFTGECVCGEDAERIIRIVSSQMCTVCNAESPLISAELAGSGARFQGVLPPVVKAPVFTIRKRALMVFSLEDYVEQGIMSGAQAQVIRRAVEEKQNILIVGGTGSGKTTLANAVLDEIAKYDERVVILEDTIELQCNVKDCVCLRTRDGVSSMVDLLKATLRLRPDRIIVGEVRGGEALSLLKAWNTGHPGGVSTVHGNSPLHGLFRLEQLIEEASANVPRDLIADAVDLIVYIERYGVGRKIRQMATVNGYDKNDGYLVDNY